MLYRFVIDQGFLLLEAPTQDVVDGNHTMLSKEQSFHLIVSESGLSYEQYFVYAYLKRSGYIVLRSSSHTLAQCNPHYRSKKKEGVPMDPGHAPTDRMSLLDAGCSSIRSRTWYPESKEFDCGCFVELTATCECTVHSIRGRHFISQWMREHVEAIASAPEVQPEELRDPTLVFTYDVFVATKTFSKKWPGVPSFRVVVCSLNDSFPSLLSLLPVIRSSFPIQLVLAATDSAGQVTLFSVESQQIESLL